MAVTIDSVTPQSKLWNKGVRSGDRLLRVNGHQVLDFLDYQFYLSEEKLIIETQNEAGKYRVCTVYKEEQEDIGLVFNDYLMDEQHHCKNKCVFCFIDQLPKGMRKTLYFKDDDSRLSFLFGNYITLTNLTQRDVERIIEMHISPVNISVHTTNPELRVKMMKSKAAGDSLAIISRLAQAGITINAQLVLCPGINDGVELKHTLQDLVALYPSVQMVAAVPLGVTKYREGLPQLTLYNQQSAAAVLDVIEGFANDCYETHGAHFAWAADEFYLKANRPLPVASYYEDFAQLENGVGMCSLLQKEFCDAVKELAVHHTHRKVTVATGTDAYPLILSLAEKICQKFVGLEMQVVPIVNYFFGETITVAGLVVGQDLLTQLNGKALGDELLIPSSMLRSEGDLFLDDVSLEQVAETLNVKVTPVRNDGYELAQRIVGA